MGKARKQAEAKAGGSRPVSREVLLQTTVQGGRSHVMPQGYADCNSLTGIAGFLNEESSNIRYWHRHSQYNRTIMSNRDFGATK